ncbi:MAG: 2-oxoacid:ferredoxin oxidoreductase subunit beta [Fimbriimonadaceae bacterium]|nr:2-oxoacid:ferredoxin oxidoreductase subunit beta [Fimbriimonadaceae bacterium]
MAQTMTAGSEPQVRKAKDYRSDLDPIWCPGCGDFGVLAAVSEVFAEQQVNPDEVVIVSGIGCSSRFPGFLSCYGFHSVHGRALPVATGVALANPKLKVLVVGGDGDGLSIGAGHFPHAARRNVNLTYLLLDNEIYGLTKGQISPTTTDLSLARKALSSPHGTWEQPINPVGLALSYGASYVARAYSAQRKELTSVISRAFRHQGFSFVQVISPCTTFYNSYKTMTPRVRPIEEDHNIHDRNGALMLAYDRKHVWLGEFYRDPDRPTLTDQFEHLKQLAVGGRPATLEAVLDRYS